MPIILLHAPREKITTIPYAADAVTTADPAVLAPFELRPNGYALVVARPEPENSILEMVGFLRAATRHVTGRLGCYQPEVNTYQRDVLAAASDEVLFPGAIYDQTQSPRCDFLPGCICMAIRSVANPALVEALGGACAVFAHDNRFNRWVAGTEAHYFQDQAEARAARRSVGR